MTSNTSPNVFDKKDTAYLRQGRVHIKYQMDSKVI